MSVPQEIFDALASVGIDLPEGTDPRMALTALSKALRAAKKALPKAAAVRFETRETDDGGTETVLRVHRGGKGAPLCVNQHAAALLVSQFDALRRFAASGEASDLEEEDA